MLTGCRHDLVDEALAGWRKRDDAPTRLASVYNPFFATTNNMVSLWAARHEMTADFVAINGDNVMADGLLEDLVANSNGPIVVPIAEHVRYDEEDMKVRVAGGRLVELNKRIALDEADGESVGVRVFRGEGRLLLSDELEAMAREDDAATAWYITAVERIAKRGGPVTVHRIGTDACMDVDFVEDLEKARARHCAGA